MTKKPEIIRASEQKLFEPPVSRLSPNSTCAECACYKSVGIGAGQGNCRKNPPRAFMFLLPPAVQAPGAQPVNYNVSGWPVVNDHDWCVDGFRARAEVVQ